jgi:hypothetical protein
LNDAQVVNKNKFSASNNNKITVGAGVGEAVPEECEEDK